MGNTKKRSAYTDIPPSMKNITVSWETWEELKANPMFEELLEIIEDKEELKRLKKKYKDKKGMEMNAFFKELESKCIEKRNLYL